MNRGGSAKIWMLRAFKAGGCHQCQRAVEDYKDLADFDAAHRLRETKGDVPLRSMAEMARTSRITPDQFLCELMKCRCLCDDCHKEETGRERRPQKPEWEVPLPLREWIEETTAAW